MERSTPKRLTLTACVLRASRTATDSDTARGNDQ